MGMKPGTTLVVGVGNTLRGDDGVGQEVAEMLWLQRDRQAGLQDASFIFAQQLTPDLALELSQAGFAVFIDSSVQGCPGSVRLSPLSPEAQEGGGHDTQATGAGCWRDPSPEGLLRLARSLYGSSCPAVLVSVSVASMALGDELSPLVRAAVPVAAAAACVAIEEHRSSPDGPARTGGKGGGAAYCA